jgi:hypothetical protein
VARSPNARGGGTLLKMLTLEVTRGAAVITGHLSLQPRAGSQTTRNLFYTACRVAAFLLGCLQVEERSRPLGSSS